MISRHPGALSKWRRLGMASALSLACLSVAHSATPAGAAVDSVVGVLSCASTTCHIGLGTVVLAADGHPAVLTALHLLEDSGTPKVYVQTAAGQTAQVSEVQRLWPDHDLALLKVSLPGVPPAAISSSKTLVDGSVQIGSWDVAKGANILVSGTLSTRESSQSLLTTATPLSVCLKNNNAVDKPCVAFTGRSFAIAHVKLPGGATAAPKFAKGNSGAPVFQDGKIVGVVVMRLLKKEHVGVMVPAETVLNQPGLLPGKPMARAALLKEAKEARVALDARTPWRFTQPKRAAACSDLRTLVSAHEMADGDSAAEFLDNSGGESLLDTTQAGKPPSWEQQALDAIAILASSPTCGPWASGIGELSKVYLQLKALQRRIGTLQTLWSAMVTAIVRPIPETKLEWEFCLSASGAGRQTILINPIERLLVTQLVGASPDPRQCLSPGERTKLMSLKPSYALSHASSVKSALGSCGDRCDGGLLNKDPGLDVQKALSRALAPLDSSAPFVTLVSDPTRQALLWKGIVRAKLLEPKAVFSFASGLHKDVLAEREAFLAHGVARVSAFRGTVDIVARQVSWSESRIHDALVKAKQADQDYNGLPAALRTATTTQEALEAFVSDTDAISRALRGEAALSDTFEGLVDSLVAFEGALGAAIVELMDEPTELGTPQTPLPATATAPPPPPTTGPTGSSTSTPAVPPPIATAAPGQSPHGGGP